MLLTSLILNLSPFFLDSSDAMLSDPTLEVAVNIYALILNKYGSIIDQGVTR